MLKVACSVCGKDLWGLMPQEEVAANAAQAVGVKCSDCLLASAIAPAVPTKKVIFNYFGTAAGLLEAVQRALEDEEASEHLRVIDATFLQKADYLKSLILLRFESLDRAYAQLEQLGLASFTIASIRQHHTALLRILDAAIADEITYQRFKGGLDV